MRRSGLIVIAALLAAGEAHGATYDVVDRIHGPPVVDGDRTLWIELPEEHGHSFRVVTARPGAPRAAQTVADPDPEQTLDPTSLASRGETVAIGVMRSHRPEDADPRDERDYLGTAVLSSRDGGVFAPFARCDGNIRQYPGVALAASAIVSVLPGCEPLSVRATPEAPPEPLVPPGRHPVADGDVVAWREGTPRLGDPSPGGDLVVYDLARRTQLLRVAERDLPGAMGGFDVDGAGRVAVSFVRGRYPRARAGVAMAAPGEPLRVLPLPRSAQYVARVAPGRVVAWRIGRSYRVSELWSWSGRTPRRIARGVYSGFDFDGATVAWGTVDCRRTVVRTAPLRSLLRRPATPRRCRR